MRCILKIHLLTVLFVLISCGQTRTEPRAFEKHYTHPIHYTVKVGDTLGAISQQFYGTAARWREIANANALDPKKLQVGQKIIIPRSGINKAKYVTQRGKASFYADKYVGRKTASGEIYKHNRLTAAHKTMKFGTRVGVRNLINDKYVQVVINDRGPFVKGRIIDLSRAAAEALGIITDGTAEVEVTVLSD